MKLHTTICRWTLLGLVTATLFSTGCTSLRPSDGPVELSSPASEAPLWQALEEAAPGDDWHVLLNEGGNALDWRLRAIDSAVHSIDLQTFLWSFDAVGSLVLDHLVLAAERGVAVRILVDDSFLIKEDDILLALADHPNIEYRIFNPNKRRVGGMVTRQLLNLAEFHRLDHRMHNKSMIVDGRVSIVGGRNLADEYFGLSESANFRDLEVLAGGPVVDKVAHAFDEYWNSQWSFPIESISHSRADEAQLEQARGTKQTPFVLHEETNDEDRLNRWLGVVAAADASSTILYYDQPPDARPGNEEEAPVQVANELIELFNEARQEIVIVSAYLIPTPRLEGAVADAVARGVRVRILTNSIRSNNHLTAHSAYRNHINALLASGAELHEVRIDARDRARYMQSPLGRKMLALHAKALIIDDDKVFIGSANLDPRSLRINTEMGLLIISQPFNASVRAAVDGDFALANAWQLELQEGGDVHWLGADNEVLTAQPASSFMQSLEDWFFAHLPIEGEM